MNKHKVEVLQTQNLRNKNQFVTEAITGNLYFQSYASMVACWIPSKHLLKVNKKVVENPNLWSHTTRKHFYIFINEFTSLSCHNIEEFRTLAKDKEIIICEFTQR